MKCVLWIFLYQILQVWSASYTSGSICNFQQSTITFFDHIKSPFHFPIAFESKNGNEVHLVVQSWFSEDLNINIKNEIKWFTVPNDAILPSGLVRIVSEQNETCTFLVNFEGSTTPTATPSNIAYYGFDGERLYSVTAVFSEQGASVEIHRELKDSPDSLIHQYCKPLSFNFSLGNSWDQFLQQMNISEGLLGQSWTLNSTDDECKESSFDSRFQLKIESNNTSVIFGKNSSSHCGMWYTKLFMSKEAQHFVDSLQAFICKNLNDTYSLQILQCGELGIPDGIPCEVKSNDTLLYVSIGIGIVLLVWFILCIALVIFFATRKKEIPYVPLHSL